MEWDDSLTFHKRDAQFYENMDEDLDLAFALSLQEEFNEDAKQEILPVETKKPASSILPSSSKPVGIVDEQWEFIDPNPDIHALFLQFNGQFFYGKLLGVEVKWSPRMTLCAGVCSYEGRGGLCSVRLSVPLLKLRPRKDLVQTLLHEMIHAYLFVTANYKDHDAHGPEFLSHMYRINKKSGTNITVYHSFHDEVDHFRQHWWKCNGPCQQKCPFYGVVKRAMNRPPGPNDRWWAQHQETCGGSFTKIKEPSQDSKQSNKRKHTKENDTSKSSADIKKYFHSDSSTTKIENTSNLKKKKGAANIQTITSVLKNEDSLVSIDSNDSLATAAVPTTTPGVFSGKGIALRTSLSSSTQPMSLLSKLRREVGFPNAKSRTQGHASKTSFLEKQLQTPNSSSSTSSFGAITNKKQSSKSSIPAKGSSSFLGDFQSAADKSTEKLKQSSINSFIFPPERTHKKDSNEVPKSASNSANSVKTVPCPVCLSNVPSKTINVHLDSCLN